MGVVGVFWGEKLKMRLADARDMGIRSSTVVRQCQQQRRQERMYR